MTRPQQYTLRTKGAPDGWASYYTGTDRTGRQLLMGWDYDGMLFLYFDSRGSLIEVVPRPVSEDPARPDLSLATLILEKLPGWRTEIGFQPGPIRVKRFWIDDPYPIGIRLKTEAMLEYSDHPGTLSTPEERTDMDRTIREFRDQGSFVLVWGDESFCLNNDGSSWD